MKRILLVLERSDDASEAISWARSLARRRAAEVLLLRVEEWPLLRSFPMGWNVAWRSSELDDVRSRLESDGGARVRILSGESATSAAVVPQARLCCASLIVLPYRPERTWIRLMSGHPAERILREATVPVLAVPPTAPPAPGPSKILFAYEDGDAAVRGLRHVIEFAQRDDASVALLPIRTPGAVRKPATERLMSILCRREVAAEVLPEASLRPLDAVSRAVRNGCGLVALSKPASRGKACSELARAVLHAVPAPLLLLGNGNPDASVLEPPSALRVGI